MAKEILEKMWDILKENEFHIDVAIKSEFACTSCKNIMVKACNVPCGCRYCRDCLINYLDDKEKFCIGESDDCKIELINIDKNVLIDQAVNIKISRIVVKCPQESCGFIGELRTMADHIRTCDKQPVACPYHTIGCQENKIKLDKMNQHFEGQNLYHIRLLMGFVENWRNDMKLLKTNMLDLKEETKWIKEQMEWKQKKILTLEENVSNLLQENRSLKELETKQCHRIKQMEEITLAMQMKSKEHNDEIEKIKKKLDEREINQEQVRSRMESISQENTSLRKELELIKVDNKAKEEIISALQSNSEEEKQEIRNLKEKIELLEKNQDKMKTKIVNIEQERPDMAMKPKQSENAVQLVQSKLTQIRSIQNCGEFLWCIPNWDEKMERVHSGIEEFICSDPFYSHWNGYKMCLKLYPNVGKTHLSLYICIMGGEFDNILKWPFRHDVRLELLNQDTGLAHVNDILSPDKNPTSNSWQKPHSDINIGIGFPQFIKLSELSSNAPLCQGNQICFRATSQMKP